MGTSPILHKAQPGGGVWAMLSPFSCVRLCATQWTIAPQAPLSMGFSRQDYWSGLPCPPPGNLPDPGIKPISLMSPASAGRFFNTILGKRQKYKKWEAKMECWVNSFPAGLLPCLGSVYLIKDLFLTDLSCNLSVVLNPVVCPSKFLLQWDKNKGKEINQPDTLISYI